MAGALEVVRVAALSDNYVWLIHDAEGGETVVVDPGEAAPVLAALDDRGWRADQVWITIVDPPTHGAERSDPGGALCQMLVRHGVKAEVTVLARTMPRISEVLARHVRDMNADMLVMGAYGHSRFRQAILGGATRNTLESTEVPVFMAH